MAFNFADGGEVEDDYTMDPMEAVNSALNYGRQKYGISGGQMGFDDGGVVPTEGEGNPNAINPQQAMAYLAGDGAVSPEIAQALEQQIDPQGQLNPTQRAAAAIGVAPNEEAKFGLLQHYRTKFNAYSGAAKAALAQGNLGEAAKSATMAMDAVPNGQRTYFAPAQGGLAMMNKPAFAQQPTPPKSQSFDDGGEVEEEVYDYTPPEEDTDEEGTPTGMPVVTRSQPTYNEDAPAEAAPSQPVADAAPEPAMLSPDQVVAALDKGFDNLVEQRGQGEEPEPTPRAPPQRPAAESGLPIMRDEPDTGFYGGVIPAADPAQAQRFRPAPEEEPGPMVRPGSVVDRARTALTPETPQPIASDLAKAAGIEDIGRPEAAPAAPAVTAPVTTRAPAPTAPRTAEGAVIDEDRVNPFTGRVRAPAQGAYGSRQEAERSGGVVPTEADIARRPSARADDMSAARRRGVVPTERELPTGNYGDSTGTLNVRTKPQNLGAFGEGGGDRRPPSAREQAVQRIKDEASELFPWVGRDQAKRDAYINANLKALGEREKAEGVERLRGDKEITRQEGMDRRATAERERKVAKDDADRLVKREREDRLREGAATKERIEQQKLVASALRKAGTDITKIQGQVLAANSGLENNPNALAEKVNALAKQYGINSPQAVQDLVFNGGRPFTPYDTPAPPPDGATMRTPPGARPSADAGGEAPAAPAEKIVVFPRGPYAGKPMIQRPDGTYVPAR